MRAVLPVLALIIVKRCILREPSAERSGLAKQMESGDRRNQLIKMAETWEVLAREPLGEAFNSASAFSSGVARE
jgi:hypothetical protein